MTWQLLPPITFGLPNVSKHRTSHSWISYVLQNSQQMLDVALWHRLWPAHNTQMTLDVTYLYCLCTAQNGRLNFDMGWLGLFLAYTHHPTNVKNGIQTLSLSFAHQYEDVRHGLKTSPLACIYIEGNIRHSQPPYILPCTKNNLRRAWTSHISLGLHITVSKYWALPACIAFALHTMVNQHQSSTPASLLACKQW